MIRNKRTEKYKSFSQKRISEVECQVCEKKFTNKYSLSNHFLIRGRNSGISFLDEAHEIFWESEKKRISQRHKEEIQNRRYNKKCYRCSRTFEEDFEGRYRKQCPGCRIKYSPRKKKPQEKFKEYPCFRCGEIIVMKLSANNKICDACRKKEREEIIRGNLSKPLKVKCLSCNDTFYYYKKHIMDRASRTFCDVCKNDPYRFKRHPKYLGVIYFLENTTLTRREIKQILNLEIDYVREAAIEKFGKEWYKKRVNYIRKRGLLSVAYKKSSGLEDLFVSKLTVPCIQNDWKVIKINFKKRRCEVDVKVYVKNGRKFALLIDGEAFHGKNCYFNPDRFQGDVDVAEKLAEMGYYTIRYSETEVKSGWANEHFSKKFYEFMKKLPEYYYRNWMTNQEKTFYACL